jgi:hypothetical protein
MVVDKEIIYGEALRLALQEPSERSFPNTSCPIASDETLCIRMR